MAVRTPAQLISEVADKFRDGVPFGTTMYARIREVLTNLTDSISAGSLGPQKLSASAVQSSHTGDTVLTTLVTETLPGGTLGPNGFLDITILFSMTGAAGSKTFYVKLGGTTFYGRTETSGASVKLGLRIHNRNNEAIQVGQSASLSGGFGITSVGLATGTVDTSIDQALIIQTQLGNAADTAAVEAYSIHYSHGA